MVGTAVESGIAAELARFSPDRKRLVANVGENSLKNHSQKIVIYKKFGRKKLISLINPFGGSVIHLKKQKKKLISLINPFWGDPPGRWQMASGANSAGPRQAGGIENKAFRKCC